MNVSQSLSPPALASSYQLTHFMCHQTHSTLYPTELHNSQKLENFISLLSATLYDKSSRTKEKEEDDGQLVFELQHEAETQKMLAEIECTCPKSSNLTHYRRKEMQRETQVLDTCTRQSKAGFVKMILSAV
jgi:hypothetical protein